MNSRAIACCIAATLFATARNAAAAEVTATAKDVDRTFVIAATQGNNAELDLARLALAQSSADEARGFAQRMLAEHAALAQRFEDTLAGKPVTVPLRLNDVDRLTLTRLANLPAVDFDQEYLTSQIGDHIAAIGVFTAEADNGSSAALKAFARRELPALHAHLEEALDAVNHIGGGSPFKSH